MCTWIYMYIYIYIYLYAYIYIYTLSLEFGSNYYYYDYYLLLLLLLLSLSLLPLLILLPLLRRTRRLCRGMCSACRTKLRSIFKLRISKFEVWVKRILYMKHVYTRSSLEQNLLRPFFILRIVRPRIFESTMLTVNFQTKNL